MNGLVVQMCWEQQQPDIIIPSMLGWEGLVGENHHNMTSYSLTILYVFLCGSYSFFFGSDCWMPLLPCFFQSLWEVSLFKMSLFERVWHWNSISAPWRDFFFFLQKTLFSSFSVYFCHCFPRLGNCLASHRCEINMSVGKTQLLSVSF